MNIADVKTTVKNAIANGVLTLSATALQSTPVETLFDAYFPTRMLVVDGVTISETTDSITVTGTGHVEPLMGVPLAATFAAPNDTAQCLISGSPGAAWRLATSFPSLEGTIFSVAAFSPGPTLTLTLDSTKTAGGTRSAGMTMTGTLSLASFAGDLGWLLGGIGVCDLSGPIYIKNGEPEIELTAKLTDAHPLPIGHFTFPALTFGLISRRVDAEGEMPEHGEAYAELTTTLTFTAKGTDHSIPLSARYLNFGGNLQFVADLSDGVLAGIEEIAENLVEGANLGGALPPSFKIPASVQLTDLIVAVDIAKKSLRGVSIGIQTTTAWPIIDDATYGNILTIEKVAAIFSFDATTKTPDAALFGTIDVGPKGVLELSGDVAAEYFGGGLRDGTSVNLSEAVEHFVGKVTDVPEFDVVQFNFDVDGKNRQFAASVVVDSTWELTIGSIALRLYEVGFSFDYADGKPTAAISGQGGIGELAIDLNWTIPGDFQLAGSLPSLALHDIIKTFSSDPLAYDYLPNPTIEKAFLYIERRADGAIYVAVGASLATSPTAKALGEIEFDFLESGGKTGFAVGFNLAPGFVLGDLSPHFSALNFLTFEQASLIVSSITDPTFSFRSFTEPTFTFPKQLPSAPPGMQSGLQLYADLALGDSSNEAMKLVSRFLKGLGGLQLAVILPTDYTKATFEAGFKGPLTIIPNWLSFGDLMLITSPFQESIFLEMSAVFTIPKSPTLTLTGRLGIAGAGIDGTLAAELDWENAFGIHGLTLQSVGAGITVSDDIGITVAGTIEVGSGDNSKLSLTAAMMFSVEAEGIPKAFFMKETEVGSLDLTSILAAFAPEIHIPAELLKVSIANFLLVVVIDDAPWPIPGTNFMGQPGLNFAGDVSFYGLEAKFGLQVTETTGIAANGSIDKPIVIGNSLRLSAAEDETKGPSAQINTTTSPFLSMSAALDLFEIEKVLVDVVVQATSLHLEFDYTITGLGALTVKGDLSGSTGFAFATEANFAVSRVGPIKAGSFTLGTLKVDLDLAAHFSISFTITQFDLTMGATFSFRSVSMTLQDLTLHDRLTRLDQLPKMFADNIAAVLWDIGKSVLQDENALFDAVREGALALTDDIGKILQKELHVAIADAAKLLKSVSNAMAYDANKVASLLKDGYSAVVSDIGKEIAGAMRAAEYLKEEVAGALRAEVTQDVTAIIKAMEAGGFALNDLASVLRNVFGYSSAEDCAKFLKNTLGAGDKAVDAALKAAEYGADAIADAMKEAFGWAKKIIDKAKKKLNPKNW